MQIAAANPKYVTIEEVPAEDQLYETSLGYVSFPIVKFVKEDQAKIVLKWNGYETTEGGYGYDFAKEKEYSYTYDWKRSGYEQMNNKTTQLY